MWRKHFANLSLRSQIADFAWYSWVGSRGDVGDKAKPHHASITVFRVVHSFPAATLRSGADPSECSAYVYDKVLALQGAFANDDYVAIIDEKEGDMRPIITTTTILAVAAAVPSIVLAQQADDRMKQAMETVVTKWTQAVNQGDSKTASSFFTSDAFGIDVYGKTSGAQMGELTKKVHDMGIDLTNKVDDVRPLGSGQVLLASGTFTVSYSKNPNLKPGETITGNWMRVLVKEGSDWKIVVQSLTRQAPPAPSK